MTAPTDYAAARPCFICGRITAVSSLWLAAEREAGEGTRNLVCDDCAAARCEPYPTGPAHPTAEQVLREIEDATSDCPLCRGERALTRCGPDNDPYPYQHAPDCPLAAALRTSSQQLGNERIEGVRSKIEEFRVFYKVPEDVLTHDVLDWIIDRSTARATAAEARIAALEADKAALVEEREAWKRVVVVCAVPLEAMRISGDYRALSPVMQRSVDEAVVTTRLAFDGRLPPEEDIDDENKPIKAIKENIAPVGVREWAVREGGDIVDRLFPNASFEERSRVSNEIAPALQAVFDGQQVMVEQALATAARLRSELAAANERAKALRKADACIAQLAQVVRWCRPRLVRDCYRDTLDRMVDLGPAPKTDEPKLVQSLTPPSEPGSTGGTT